MNIESVFAEVALVILVGLAGAAWNSPRFLQEQSLRFDARAKALRKSRAVYRLTYNKAIGRRPATPTAADAVTPRRSVLARLGAKATLLLSVLGCTVIVACIAALVEMPQ
jgi:hypothetical protein